MKIIKESSMPSFRISAPSCSVLAEDAAYVSIRQHTSADDLQSRPAPRATGIGHDERRCRFTTDFTTHRGFAESSGPARNRDLPAPSASVFVLLSQ